MPADALTQRVGGVYFLRDGTQRDPFNLQGFHPVSNVNRLEVYLEDGVSTNLVMVNFKADSKGYPASQWFPALYSGTVQHIVSGEATARTFAKYWLLVPPQVLQWNANGSGPLGVAGTVVQSAGDSLLGAYQNVSALQLAQPATEDLYDDGAVAYCYETEGENLYGFYMISYDGDVTYSWAKIENPITQVNMVETKQYNIVGMQIQKGNLPRPTSTVTISDEYIRYILAYIADVNDKCTINISAIIDGTQAITYDPTISGLVSTTLKTAVDEIVGMIDDIEQDILDLQTNKEDKSNKATSWESPDNVKYPTTKMVHDRLVIGEGRTTALETANMVKSVARTGTDLITLTKYDNTTLAVITLAEFRSWLGNATQSVAGLMSAQDKTDLDTLMALFDTDADDVVNTIAEILAIFEDYPEGVDLVTVLASKVDKTQIVNDLTTGGATDVLSAEQGKTLQTTTEKVANKATDFSTVNDTKYPSVQAVRNYVRDIGLDTPITELNNHSLREVFEDEDVSYVKSDSSMRGVNIQRSTLPEIAIFNGTNESATVQYGLVNLIQGDDYYVVYKYISGSFSGRFVGSYIPVYNQSSTSKFTASAYNYIRLEFLNGETATDYNLSLRTVRMTSLGIDNLTVSQMDYWYFIYKSIKLNGSPNFVFENLSTMKYDLEESKETIDNLSSPIVMTKIEAIDKYGLSFVGKLLQISNLGSEFDVNTYANDLTNSYTLIIDIGKTYAITYPIYKSVNNSGSLMLDEDGVVIWAHTETLLDTGTEKTVIIPSNAKYFYLNISPTLSTMEYNITMLSLKQHLELSKIKKLSDMPDNSLCLCAVKVEIDDNKIPFTSGYLFHKITQDDNSFYYGNDFNNIKYVGKSRFKPSDYMIALSPTHNCVIATKRGERGSLYIWDGVTNTRLFATAETKPMGWLYNSGVEFVKDDENVEHCIFAEYSPDAGTATGGFKVWRGTAPYTSEDDWEIVFSQNYIGDTSTDAITHFHQVRRDPFTNILYLTSGDGHSECKWWYSEDSGETWDLLTSGVDSEWEEHTLRCINFIFTKDYVYWATDKGTNHSLNLIERDSVTGIFDINTRVKISDLPIGRATNSICYVDSPKGIFMYDRVDIGFTDYYNQGFDVQFWSIEDEELITVMHIDLTSETWGGHRGKCYLNYTNSIQPYPAMGFSADTPCIFDIVSLNVSNIGTVYYDIFGKILKTILKKHEGA